MAAEAFFNDAKIGFQTAFEHATKSKEEAEGAYNQEKEVGLVENKTFDQWWPQNYPAYAAAKQAYQASRARYEQALGQVNAQGLRDWQDKIRQSALDNRRPDGSPDFDVLIGPDE
ncbi:hypothetical protein NM208_g3165 [Fusarium decemcellulare]|uniref:Uncharacterized protein n=1 Tax=Fusarium decemcellulare TaxID=57161 RepID=A0ACC1SQ76_9HYPO|nr:hypothetical protein NM208_g3165 [Fusarium decemcellulare]